MPPFILIGLAAGGASALLFISAAAGDPAGRVVLFFMAPLPGFLAGLGWGARSAGIAAVSSAIICGGLLGLASGGYVLATQGIPVTVLCYLASLSRDLAPTAVPASITSTPSIAAAPHVEWYPVGRLIAIATVMAGVLALLTVVVFGADLDDMRKILRASIEQLQQLAMFKDSTISEQDKASLTEVMLYLFPAASSLSWLIGLLLNFYLAGRITLASGRLPRPWPDLAAIDYPRGFGLGLALSLGLLAATVGIPRLVASGFAGAFVVAYFLLGLAVIHYVTRGTPARPFLLWGLYLCLFFFNMWAALALALVGILEPLLPWRHWKEKRRPGPD